LRKGDAEDEGNGGGRKRSNLAGLRELSKGGRGGSEKGAMPQEGDKCGFKSYREGVLTKMP